MTMLYENKKFLTKMFSCLPNKLVALYGKANGERGMFKKFIFPGILN